MNSQMHKKRTFLPSSGNTSRYSLNQHIARIPLNQRNVLHFEYNHRKVSAASSSTNRDRRNEIPPQQQQLDASLGPRQSTQNDLDLWMNRLRRGHQTQRHIALEELLRIDEGGAFAGLVSGGPQDRKDTHVLHDTDEDKDLRASSASLQNTTNTSHQRNEKTTTTSLSQRDRRQATNIVSGVTRWQRRLAWVLMNLPKKTNLASMDAPLRLILFMATYELFEMGMASHAINDYVNLTKHVMHEGAAKVTNGVLRTIVRCIEGGTLPKPAKPVPGSPRIKVADALGVATSHPTWMVDRWLEAFDYSTTLALLKCNNARPRYSIRLAPGIDPATIDTTLQELQREKIMDRQKNTQENTSSSSSFSSTISPTLAEVGLDDISVSASRYLPTEFIVVESGLQHILASGLISKGKGQVQDEAAGLVVALLDPKPYEALLDCCAAPGGKALFSAARMQGKGTLVALDSSAARLKALQNTARNQGILKKTPTTTENNSNGNGGYSKEQAKSMYYTNRVDKNGVDNTQNTTQHQQQHRENEEQDEDSFMRLAVGDCRGYCVNAAAAGDSYDKVLVDAPCSGTGVLAKRADLRWRRRHGDISQLAELQHKLLDAASHVVKPNGGVLVYSTCSIEHEENRDVVMRFLKDHPDFEIQRGDGFVPGECLNEEGMLCMLPHIHGTDGAFACRMIRK